MKEEIYYVITFNSTHHAIKAEKKLLDKNLDIKTIPTPREITASCGLSIKFPFEDLEVIKATIKENLFDVNGVFQIMKTSTGKKAIQI